MKDNLKIALKIDDIRSIISFREWLKDNLDVFKSKNPSNEEVLIYLDYIKNSLYSERLSNKKEYLKKIKRITKRVKDGR